MALPVYQATLLGLWTPKPDVMDVQAAARD